MYRGAFFCLFTPEQRDDPDNNSDHYNYCNNSDYGSCFKNAGYNRATAQGNHCENE